MEVNMLFDFMAARIRSHKIIWVSASAEWTSFSFQSYTNCYWTPKLHAGASLQNYVLSNAK